MFFVFFLHALILILHFLSLKPLQSTSVGDDGGGADGGSGSHLSQVFLHFCHIAGSLHFFFLHFLEVSTHGGDGVGGGGEGLGGGGEGMAAAATAMVAAETATEVRAMGAAATAMVAAATATEGWAAAAKGWAAVVTETAAVAKGRVSVE